MDPFHGIPLRVEPSMAGAKVACRIGSGPVLVSPAMWDLIQNATGDELNDLLRAIKVVSIPDFSNRNLMGAW
jgi:hypothetical protein